MYKISVTKKKKSENSPVNRGWSVTEGETGYLNDS